MVDVLDVAGLEVGYGSRTVVKDVSFTVEEGEVVALLGPNGAGKTTILSAVEGLHAPRVGHIRVCGVDASERPRHVRACLGVGLQSTAFQPELTLEELVWLFGRLYGHRLSRAHARARLARLGLEAEARRRPDQLSGGQRQHLVLAIALVHHPKLVILDEPTSGLDPQSRRELWEAIARLRGEGSSVLFTTHTMEEAAAMSDRIAILSEGAIIASGSPEELVARFARDPRVQRVCHSATPTLEDVFVGLTGRTAVRRAEATTALSEGWVQ